MAESMETDCRDMAYCGVFLHDEMECADSLAETESIDSEMSEIPPPPVRREESIATHRNAERRLSVREQEIQYIEQHGLVDFCHGAIFSAILQDADYLRAQLTYLGK
jgi:hypothetical protein